MDMLKDSEDFRKFFMEYNSYTQQTTVENIQINYRAIMGLRAGFVAEDFYNEVVRIAEDLACEGFVYVYVRSANMECSDYCKGCTDDNTIILDIQKDRPKKKYRSAVKRYKVVVAPLAEAEDVYRLHAILKKSKGIHVPSFQQLNSMKGVKLFAAYRDNLYRGSCIIVESGKNILYLDGAFGKERGENAGDALMCSIIQYYKDMGFEQLDMGGIGNMNNPISHFKMKYSKNIVKRRTHKIVIEPTADMFIGAFVSLKFKLQKLRRLLKNT